MRSGRLGWIVLVCGLGIGGFSEAVDRTPERPHEAAGERRPNFVIILADDLGYGEVGCYGQTKIRTPHLDQLAAAGMRFTQHYSGSPVCASSRCVLLTGKHTGHCFARDNSEVGDWSSFQGQKPLPADEVTLAERLAEAGYATACVGKWGLGRIGSTGDPNRQGFDLFYGYNCQRQSHNYYPRYLVKNDQHVALEGNDRGVTGAQYATDSMIREALAFVDEHHDAPFFLYYATPVPHAALQVPEDSLAEYEGAFPETPYDGKKGYLPHPTPRAAYAAMVTRMDRNIGRILAKLEEHGVADDTIVIFTSDNGPTFNGGTDSEFFESAGPLRGRKTQLYEGGIRVPFIVRWPGRIAEGSVSDHVSAFWDLLVTCTELAGAPSPEPEETDGISLVPTWLGEGEQREHPYLYWEYARKRQALRMGRWKAIRARPDRPIELYDLEADLEESENLAAEHPEIVARAASLFRTARTPSQEFPLWRKKPSDGNGSGKPKLNAKGWKIRASSESVFNGKTADQAFDGDVSTWWHSEWRDAKPKHPHDITIEFGANLELAGFRIHARGDRGKNGWVERYALYRVGPDGRRTSIVEGVLEPQRGWQEITIEPTSARTVIFSAKSTFGGGPFASVGELEFIPAPGR